MATPVRAETPVRTGGHLASDRTLAADRFPGALLYTEGPSPGYWRPTLNPTESTSSISIPADLRTTSFNGMR